MRINAEQADFRPWNFSDDQEPWPERMLMPGLFCLAWLLFELTANATLSILVACLRFGWEDFRTAWWLRRMDPQPARARTGFWFYLASGVWKTALVPVLAVMILSIGWGLIAPRALALEGRAAQQIWSALAVGAVASGILIFLVGIGVVHALVGNVQMWVHHDLHRSRRANLWPPEWIRPVWQHDNRGRAILATALIAATIGSPIVLFGLVIHLQEDFRALAVLALVFAPPIGATLTYAALRSRVFALRPWHCWPESDDPTHEFLQDALEEGYDVAIHRGELPESF